MIAAALFFLASAVIIGAHIIADAIKESHFIDNDDDDETN